MCFKNGKKVFSLLVIFCMVAGISPVYAADISLANADFESVVSITPGTNNWSGDKRPTVWQNPNRVNTPADVGFIAQIDADVKHSGNYSLKLGSQDQAARIMVSQNISGLDPEKTYRLSGYVKTENYVPAALSSAGPVIQVLVDNTTNYYATTSIETPTADWTYVENIFSPGAQSVRLDCNFIMGTGYAWFDDIKIEEYIPVRSITLSRDSLSLHAGESVVLSAQPYPECREDITVSWSSSDNDIATVDAGGRVTAVGKKSGRAAISATVTENICVPSTGGKKVSPQIIEKICVVDVPDAAQDVPVTALSLNQVSAVLTVGGGGLELIPSVKPEAAINRTITWSSSDNGVAAVVDGLVIPKAAGSAVIYAEADGVKTGCSITVQGGAEAPVLTDKSYVQTENFDDIVTASGYPKLLFDMSQIDQIRAITNNPLYRKSYLTMADSAYSYLTLASAHPQTASGGRVLNKRISELALVGYINKDMRYIDKAVAYMMGSSDKYTAVDYNNMNGDIALGDAAHAYAVGYDWLYPFMTDAQRRQIEEELDGLIDALYAIVSKEESGQIPAVTSNHNAVSAGGMGLAALVRGNRPDAVELARARTIAYYQTSADSDGFSFEGIGYYCYGLLGAATFNAALERAGGGDMLEEAPAYCKTLDMITYYTNPDGKDYVAVGDSSERVAPAGGVIYLISKYQNSTALWNFLRMSGDDGNRSYGGGDDYQGASIPYMLIFADPNLLPQEPFDMPLSRVFESGFVSMRDGWAEDSSFVTFTSSEVPHRGHNQRDENSFTFYAFHENFLIDPGYTPTETSSHNAVLINGAGQSVPGNRYDVYGSVDECLAYDGMGYVRGDASGTYSTQTDIDGVKRGILYRGGASPYMVVVDDIAMPEDVNANIQVLYQTDRANKVVLNNNADEIKIIGAQTGAVMKITCPFTENTIMRTGNYEGREITGGRGDYVVSDFSKTAEALTNVSGNARIVSLIMTAASDEEYPETVISGTADDGHITIKFKDGRTDYITITDDDIRLNGVKVEWSADGGAVSAAVTILPSINEAGVEGELYAAAYEEGRLASIQKTDFTLSENEQAYTISFDPDKENRLFFWRKDTLAPLFDDCMYTGK